MNKIILAIGLAFSTLATAGTDCNEWATMTQVLVIRWQGDIQFKGKTAEDVKRQLTKQMEGHPELDKALKYVDLAYKRRNDNPVDVWKQTFASCNAVSI